MLGHTVYQKGQGLIEYAFIIVLIALVVLVMISVFGTALGNIYSMIITSL